MLEKLYRAKKDEREPHSLDKIVRRRGDSVRNLS